MCKRRKYISTHRPVLLAADFKHCTITCLLAYLMKRAHMILKHWQDMTQTHRGHGREAFVQGLASTSHQTLSLLSHDPPSV